MVDITAAELEQRSAELRRISMAKREAAHRAEGPQYYIEIQKADSILQEAKRLEQLANEIKSARGMVDESV